MVFNISPLVVTISLVMYLVLHCTANVHNLNKLFHETMAQTTKTYWSPTMCEINKYDLAQYIESWKHHQYAQSDDWHMLSTLSKPSIPIDYTDIAAHYPFVVIPYYCTEVGAWLITASGAPKGYISDGVALHKPNPSHSNPPHSSSPKRSSRGVKRGRHIPRIEFIKFNIEPVSSGVFAFCWRSDSDTPTSEWSCYKVLREAHRVAGRLALNIGLVVSEEQVTISDDLRRRLKGEFTFILPTDDVKPSPLYHRERRTAKTALSPIMCEINPHEAAQYIESRKHLQYAQSDDRVILDGVFKDNISIDYIDIAAHHSFAVIPYAYGSYGLQVGAWLITAGGAPKGYISDGVALHEPKPSHSNPPHSSSPKRSSRGVKLGRHIPRIEIIKFNIEAISSGIFAFCWRRSCYKVLRTEFVGLYYGLDAADIGMVVSKDQVAIDDDVRRRLKGEFTFIVPTIFKDDDVKPCTIM